MTTRQDAWTEEEDSLLAEVVLRHIREGDTQLSAFKEVGKLLSRTSAACGFRWNSYVRKLHQGSIDEAKQWRKSLGQQSTIQKQEKTIANEEQVTIEQIIELLQTMKSGNVNYFQLHQELQVLQREKESLEQRLVKVESEYLAFLDFVEQKRSVVLASDTLREKIQQER